MKYICQYCGKEFDSKIGKSVHELYCINNSNRPILKCQYCGQECKTLLGLKNHENSCKNNLNKKEKVINKKYICPYCNREFTNGGAYKKHILTCNLNPNKKKYKYDKHINNEEEITCQYCGQIFKSKSNKTQHEAICKLNPNRIARTIRQKYDMMTNEELLKEVKKYNSRKETPNQLISICKERNIYSWYELYVKEHKLTNDELINELNKYTKLSEIPRGIKVECKRRNISLQERFNKLSLIKQLRLLSDEELINILNKFSNKKECLSNKEGSKAFYILKKERNNTNHIFFRQENFGKYHYYTNEEIINIINKYSSKKELYKNGYIGLINEINKRNIFDKLPNWFNYKPINYKEKTDDELIELVKNIKNRKELNKIGLEKVFIELKRRNLEIYKKFTKNYHPEYKNMTDDELINIINTEYKDKNIRYLGKHNRPLINELRKRNIQYIAFPDSDKSYYGIEYGIKLGKEKWGDKFDYSKVNKTYKNWHSKIKIGCPIHGFFDTTFSAHLGYKFDGCPICSLNIKINNIGGYSRDERLRMISKYDLLSMSWAVIIDLIGINKLPKEFQVLTKYGENTPERKKMIQDLIDSYNIEVPENDIDETNNDSNNDEIIETEVNNITDEDTNIYDNENEELNPFKETKTIGEILGEDFDETLFSTGDKWLHIMSKEIGKLWNKVLRDNENHNENTINEIHQKLINNSLTKFEKYIYEEFIKEYDEVINLEVH